MKNTRILLLTYQIGPNPKALQHTLGEVAEKRAHSGLLGRGTSLCRNLLHLGWEEGCDTVVHLSLLSPEHFPCSDPPVLQSCCVHLQC